MRLLSFNRRNVLSDVLTKIALMAAAGLIFGQFVPNQQVDKQIIVWGIILTWILISLAVLAKPE